MEKVLIHDDENEDVHYIKGSFLGANKTLCGQRLHPINTIHVRKFDVTCEKCLEIVKKTGKKRIKELNSYTLYHSDLKGIRKKIDELVRSVNVLKEKGGN